MLQLLIVDDSKWTRDGLAQIIDWSSLGIEICATSSSAAKACEILASNHVDLLITDIKMTGMDGLELTEHVHTKYPHIKTILISAYKEFDYAYKAVQLGVAGYILKPIVPDDLLKTVQSITASMVKQSTSDFTDNSQEPDILEQTENSSSTGKKIVKSAKNYIAQNLSDKNLSLRQIADDLHINYYYLSKCFKESEKISFIEYVTNKRLQIASNLLSSTSLHVYEVCEQIGMEPKNFHTLFRKRFNMTPQEYRKNYKQTEIRTEIE